MRQILQGKYGAGNGKHLRRDERVVERHKNEATLRNLVDAVGLLRPANKR